MLADIAIQSADSATNLGIPPRVAMISYSTGESGQGADVDKVREATRIARAKRPDLVVRRPAAIRRRGHRGRRRQPRHRTARSPAAPRCSSSRI